MSRQSWLEDNIRRGAAGTIDPVLFDPVSGTKSFPPGSNSIQGCHIPTLMADGRLLFIGGQDTGDFRDATRMVKAFDPSNGTWEVLPQLNEQRWYPGMVRLGDGRFLVMGGGQRPNAQRTETCEIFDSRNRTWTVAASMSNPAEYTPAVLLRTGKVLRSWWPPQLYDPALNRWDDTGPMVQANRFWPGHCDHSLFRLSDGRACAVGIYRGTLTSPSMIDLYDPATNTWHRCADMAWYREYHATTLLVPDGRVITTAGTGGPANPGVSNDIEAFEPPYLFRGIRPRIEAVSATSLPHGSNITLSISRTNALTDVVLVGTGAVTHWVDGGLPLIVPLTFIQQGQTVTATIPANVNFAPAGHYMLFALVDGIPSKSIVINVKDSVTVSVPPQRPSTEFIGSASPNPFTTSVQFRWFQPQSGRVALSIHDLSGRRVIDRPMTPGVGWHDFEWDGRSDSGKRLAAGVYFLRLNMGSRFWTSRIVSLGR